MIAADLTCLRPPVLCAAGRDQPMVREISGAETLLVWVETTKGVSNVHAAYSTGECEVC